MTQFKARTNGYSLQFHSTYFTYLFDTITCDVTFKTFGVAYSLSGRDGKVVKLVHAVEDPDATKVVDVIEQNDIAYYDNDTPNWVGYEIAGSSDLSVPVYEAKSTFSVPSISTPNPPSNACRTDLGKQKCSASTWTGLEDQAGAHDGHLVQGGVDPQRTCTSSSCITTNKVFFEFLPSATNYCGGMTFSAGDSVTVTVTNQKKTGGSNTAYNVDVEDTTSGQGCSTTGQSYTAMNNPIRGDFIIERPDYGGTGVYATLAQFNTITHSSATV